MQRTNMLTLAVCCGALLLPGCGNQSSTKNNSKESSSTSKASGKTYPPSPKSGQGGQGAGASGQNQQQGGGKSAALPSPADTVNYQASAASDAGLSTADQGAPVMNPGVPIEGATPKSKARKQKP